MLSYSTKHFGVFKHIHYFSDKPELKINQLFCEYNQTASTKYFFGFIKKNKFTILIDLKIDENSILSSFDKDTIYDVKRSIRDNEVYIIGDSQENFNFCYKAFKNDYSSNIDISMFPNIVFSCLYFNSKPVIAHSYIIDASLGRVRLLHSFSGVTQIEDSSLKAKIGRGNRMLHYKDMIYFKNLGIKIYDFGGYAINTNNSKLIGINRFKAGFGGKIKKESDYMSIPLWILKKLVFI